MEKVWFARNRVDIMVKLKLPKCAKSGSKMLHL